MIEYIYFVKCPDCEDEHFSFFDEARTFALGCLDNKPIITQTEVCRNDFGECTDSKDLGTIWSWEDLMTDVSADEPAASVFTQGDFAKYNPEHDEEFDSLDNSLDSIPDNFRKPVPAGMTIESLVEEMEESEDIVECKWCDELFNKSECRYEVDLGWLCSRCEAAIKSRGETLTFRENNYWDFLDESFNGKEVVEFDYNDLEVTLLDNNQDWETGAYGEHEETVSYTFRCSKEDVATELWESEIITEEDVSDVPGGLEALEDEAAWYKYLETHFDALLAKYYDKLLEIYREQAAEEYQENHSYEDYWQTGYDDYMADRYDESIKPASMLEKLEEPENYNERLTPCPECGSITLDPETRICINCGFEI